jgi:hypothetical protein
LRYEFRSSLLRRPKRFAQSRDNSYFTGGNQEFAEGLAYALERGWIIQNDGNYEITEDGCFAN